MKSLLKSLAARSGAVGWMIAATRRRIRILMYHGVSPHTLPPELFEKQLKYVRRHFECFWASQLPELLDGSLRPKRTPMVLTFDDGLRNNHEFAAPLLQQYGVKATFYVISDLLDGRSMLWNHELLCRLLLEQDNELPAGVGPFGSDRYERFIRVRDFVQTAKSWSEEHRRELLTTLRDAGPAPKYEPWMREKYTIMSREELRSLPDNIEIGSHTRTHPILTGTDDGQALDEIKESRTILESILGRPVTTFCYPDGRFSDRHVDYARQAYSVAISVDEGLVGRNDNRHTLNRIPAAHNMRDFVLRMVKPDSGAPTPESVPEQ